MTNTINEIYDAINPIPAMLSAKGKVSPEVTMMANANANLCIHIAWVKVGGRPYDRECEVFSADTFDEALTKTIAFISALPDAKTARLHDFMSQLGRVIDSGRDLGIEVDYLNPLTETMKRLSENIITHQPECAA
jgi:hypothetical protein